MTKLRMTWNGSLLAACLVLCLGVQANAATLTVTTLADAGPGTLRDQVAAAAPGDTISLAVTGTITLNGTQSITIAKDLTISGPGASSLAVSTSSYVHSIFHISSGIVAISGITMRDGSGEPGAFGEMSGGALYMTAGSVTLTNCVLTNNRVYASYDNTGFAPQKVGGYGGAIFQTGGSLSLVSCSVSGNTAGGGGGGISTQAGSLSISRCAISGNTASDGFAGGIYNSGTATLRDSTISGNHAINGAYSTNNHGGGIMQAGNMTITNCTISGNSCDSNVPLQATDIVVGGGGISAFNGTLTVANSTITNNFAINGGGIRSAGGTLNLTNTIVAGNDSRNSGSDVYGPVASGDYNLLQNVDTQLLAPPPGTHNILGQPALLAPLANNGGPTQTQALLAGSLAFDAGDPAFDAIATPYDQRGIGFPRVRSGRIDIGAYESEDFQGGGSLIVNTLADHDDGMCGVDDCTLREAVKYATSGATITFSVTGTITLTLGELLSGTDVTIIGPTTAPGITISGNNITRIFTSTAALSVSTLTLTGGNGVGSLNSGNGGSIFTNSNALTVNNCTFSGNIASAGTGNGGAIYNVAAALTVSNSTFSNNTATGNAGAIRNNGILTVSNCTFTGNRALGTAVGSTGDGGAMRTAGTSVFFPTTINNSTFSGNTALHGGAIFSTAATLNLSNSIVAGNSATTAPEISGIVTGGDYDLVQDPSGATFPASSIHNITGQPALLGPLANNGGPTQTLALLPGSPAIDGGDPAFDTTTTPYDQRGSGYSRKVGSAIDIGAFEVPPPTVTLSLTGSPMAEAGGVATVTATLSNAFASPVTVNLGFSGTATPTSDYTASGTSIVIPAGSTSGSITLTAVQDTINEPNETIVVDATTVTNGTLATPQQVTATIIDDDPLPTLTINSVSQAEGNAGTTNFNFTVTLTGATAQTVTVNYATANGTAVAPGDYATTNGTLTFAPGTTTQTVTVPVVGDTVNEANETFTVGLSGATLATILTPAGTGTILNDDAAPALTINNVTQAEGTGGTTNFVFTVTLTGSTAQSVTVNYATADGTATAPADYATTGGTLTFTPGTLTQTITVPVVADSLNEADETFTVGLSGATIATITSATGTGTITNDDPLPALSINSTSQAEGNSGTTPMNFTVTLSAPSGQIVTASYTTADGSAVAGSDYTLTSGTVTFAPGVTVQTIPVAIIGDTTNEADETFSVTLSSPANATITTSTGTGTITNDDAVPALTINSPSQVEGNSGTAPMNFVVTLSAASGQTVTVNYSTANGTATAGSDYTAAGGTLTFAPGVTTQTIPVSIIGDTVNEPNETFTVTLATPVNATIASATGTGTGTIVNDDGSPTLSIGSPSQAEGNSGTANMSFVVTLSPASGQTVTVNYATADGTATAGSDYTVASGTLTFAPGTTSQTINVPILGDTLNEPDETFTVNLTAPVNATVAAATGRGTIVNDDALPVLSINNVSQPEGNSGTSAMNFTVTLSAASGQTVLVNYATANGTATAGSDYTATSGTLTFAPGVLTQTIAIPVIGDTVNEPDETFTVTLSAATNATITTATGTGTIVNDDGAPSLSINNASQPEGNSGTSLMNFTVSLSAASAQTVTVNYITSNGTATAGSDYTATSGTLTFAPGVLTQTIAIPVIGDTVNEPDETFAVTLSAATNATITTATGTGTIVNDDAAAATPLITTIAPATGGTTGGQSVTITGTNLAGAISVTFGGIAGLITADTSTSITVTAPAHAAGAVDVVVTTTIGSATSPNAYTFAAAAAIPALSGWMLLALMAAIAMVGWGKLRS